MDIVGASYKSINFDERTNGLMARLNAVALHVEHLV